MRICDKCKKDIGKILTNRLEVEQGPTIHLIIDIDLCHECREVFKTLIYKTVLGFKE